jgi:hypothetical protein
MSNEPGVLNRRSFLKGLIALGGRSPARGIADFTLCIGATAHSI